MNRRDMLRRTGAAALTLGLSSFPLGWSAAADSKKPRLLMFTKSGGFQHSVVKRPKGGGLSLAERIVTELGAKHGFEVECTKDGRVFTPDNLAKFDGFVFETQGDLTRPGVDKEPPMTPEGLKAFLDAVAGGKCFVGSHCASDTNHSKGPAFQNQPRDKQTPYIRMLGGEFIRHGAQQKAWIRVVDHHFPGTQGLKDFELMEEWYSLKNFAPDLHVILVQDTHGMKGFEYERPSYPETWARMHHKGRVFFTSMGHREDVWENPKFQQILLGGINWATGKVNADISPNLAKVTPHASELPMKK